MRRALFMLVGGLLLGVPRAGVSQDPNEEVVFIEQVDPRVLKDIDEDIAAQNWKKVFHQDFMKLLRENERKVVKSPDGKEKYLSYTEFLIYKFSTLPAEALRNYRVEFDGVLQAEYRRGMAEGDMTRIERALERYFFATAADRLMDSLANRYVEGGEFARAELHWRRLLRFYPDSSLDSAVVAAKLLFAAQMLGSDAALNQAKNIIKDRKISGTVIVGGGQVSLDDLVAKAAIKEDTTDIAVVSLKYPSIFLKSSLLMEHTTFPSNDLKKANFKFSYTQANVRLVPQVIPAYVRMGGRQYLLYQDGMVITAVDPDRASLASEQAAILWTNNPSKSTKRPTRGQARSDYQVRYVGPQMGVTIDGDSAFANMYSPQEEEPVQNPNFGQFYQPLLLNNISRFDLKTGTRRANSDPSVYLSGKDSHEFAKEKFYFCAPLVIQGDKLYVGVVTERSGDQESYVVCMDKMSLKVLWSTFLCQGQGQTPGRGNTMDYFVYPTMVQVHNGTVYALSNLGVTAALDASTGNIRWLTKYERAKPRFDNRTGQMIAGVDRPPSLPIIYKNSLYCLPMDGRELMIYDLVTGETGTMEDMPSGYGWENMTHLVGFVGTSLVLSGNKGLVVKDLAKNFVHKQDTSLTRPDSGMPCIYENYVFVPSIKEISKGGELCVYEAGSWRLRAYQSWPSTAETGNVLIAGETLVVSRTDGISLWESARSAFRGHELRSAYSPVDPELIYDYALNLLNSYESRHEIPDLRKAREKFSVFLWSADGDPKFVDRIRDSKLKLYDVFVKLGDDARQKARWDEAVELYQAGKEYAYAPQASAQVSIKLAEAYEGAGQPREAILEYQEIIGRMRQASYTPPDSHDSEPMWSFASKRVAKLVAAQQAQIGTWIEERASEALKGAGNEISALLQLVDLYPSTAVAKDVLSRIGDGIEALPDPFKRLEMIRRIRNWYRDQMNLRLYGLMLSALEDVEDYVRLRAELAMLKKKFAGAKVDWNGKSQTIEQFVSEKLSCTDCQCPVGLRRIGAKMTQVSRMGVVEESSGPAIVRTPLLPDGPAPADLNLELVKYGSAIQLWDLAAKRMIWEVIHPGVFSGISYQQDQNDAVVVREVAKPSPASGIVIPNDAIVSVNDRPVTATTFQQVLQSYKVGDDIKLTLRRNNGSVNVRIKLSAIPPSAPYGLVGAAYAQNGRVVVAWEDRVACLELKTGAPVWEFNEVRELSVLRAILPKDGRVYLFEGAGFNQAKHPYRKFQQGTTTTADAPQHRLFVFDDATGEVVKIKEVEMDAGSGGVLEAKLFGDYFSDTLLGLIRTPMRVEVRSFSADGQQLQARQVLSTPATPKQFNYAYEPRLGRLYIVYGDPNSGQHWVRGFDATQEVWGSGFNLIQNTHIAPNTQSLLVAANRDYVCVVSYSANGSRAAVFTNEGKFKRLIDMSVHDKSQKLEPVALCLEQNKSMLFVYKTPPGGSGKEVVELQGYFVDMDSNDPGFTGLAPALLGGNERRAELEVGKDTVVLTLSRVHSESKNQFGPFVTIYQRGGQRNGRLIWERIGYDRGGWMPVVTRGRIFMVDRDSRAEVVLGVEKRSY